MNRSGQAPHPGPRSGAGRPDRRNCPAASVVPQPVLPAFRLLLAVLRLRAADALFSVRPAPVQRAVPAKLVDKTRGTQCSALITRPCLKAPARPTAETGRSRQARGFWQAVDQLLGGSLPDMYDGRGKKGARGTNRR